MESLAASMYNRLSFVVPLKTIGKSEFALLNVRDDESHKTVSIPAPDILNAILPQLVVRFTSIVVARSGL